MTRPSSALLLTLPALMLAMPAQAQTARGAPVPQTAEERFLPRGSWIFEEDEPDTRPVYRAQQRPQLPGPISREEVDAAPLPPPGFATPNGRPPMPSQQLDSRVPGTAAVAPERDLRPPAGIGGSSAAPLQATSVAALPPEDQPEVGQPKELPPHLKKQLVDYKTKEPAGTIIVDTPNTYLYLVLGDGKALRYGIGVGREGFTWSGAERVSRMSEWPDWHPPSEMIERQPYLPRFMAGGPGNPMGARALYLGKTLYRIHGTNQPSTIGQNVSSGCIRLLNEDIADLYSRVQVGSRVVVLPGKAPDIPASASTGSASSSVQGPARAAVSSSPLPAAR